MPEIKLPLSQAQQRWELERGSKSVNRLHLYPSSSILFWSGKPVAVYNNDAVYHHQPDRTSACTKAINEFGLGVPHVDCDAGTFDFVLGSLLTRAGMPLTMGLKGGK